jgi:hypothetical protein
MNRGLSPAVRYLVSKELLLVAYRKTGEERRKGRKGREKVKKKNKMGKDFKPGDFWGEK